MNDDDVVATNISVTCPRCGDRRLTPADITLVYTQADRAKSFYAFTCPACDRPVNKAAPTDVRALLRGAGARVCVLDGPPASCPPGPITEAEIDDFRFAVADIKSLTRFAARRWSKK